MGTDWISLTFFFFEPIGLRFVVPLLFLEDFFLVKLWIWSNSLVPGARPPPRVTPFPQPTPLQSDGEPAPDGEAYRVQGTVYDGDADPKEGIKWIKSTVYVKVSYYVSVRCVAVTAHTLLLLSSYANMPRRVTQSEGDKEYDQKKSKKTYEFNLYPPKTVIHSQLF